MIGSAEAGLRSAANALRLRARPQLRYLAVDGGSGAHLLEALADTDPRLERAASPRHANLLVVTEPVNQKLAPALVEVARALPRPRHGIVIGDEPASAPGDGALVRAEELLPGIRRLPAGTAQAVAAAMRIAFTESEIGVPPESGLEPETIALPGRRELEIATEPIVFSLGPIQPFTAGPLRLLLVCDGEQVRTARVDAGYAHRRLACRMMRTSHVEAARLAESLDPLAPLAGRLTYVRAVERLQRWEAPDALTAAREATLGLERAHNHLWWLARFLRVVALGPLVARAAELAQQVAAVMRDWPGATPGWLVPGAAPPALPGDAAARLGHVVLAVVRLHEQLRGNRLLGLRTNGIGVVAFAQVARAGVTGPARSASDGRPGDVRTRLLTRLELATADLERAAHAAARGAVGTNDAIRWSAPAGEAEAEVEGPRGRIGLRLVSDGGDGPSRVAWRRPSAALLDLLPDALPGQKLADVELFVASLDLSMAEADG